MDYLTFTPPATYSENMKSATDTVLDKYRKQMTEMFGNTKLPSLLYKGRVLPERML